MLMRIFTIPIFPEIFYAVARESYFYLYLHTSAFELHAQMHAGQNGVIAGYGTSDLEGYYLDG